MNMNNTIIVRGNIIQFPILIEESLRINTEFKVLFKSVLDGENLDFSDFELASLDFFDEVEKRFGSAKEKSDHHNHYFQAFAYLCNNYFNGQMNQIDYFWDLALKPAFKWEQLHNGSNIHKGTAFYFWGMSSIINNEIDKGYLLFHQALSEDQRTFNSDFPETPSFYFVSLNYSQFDQAFREWVVMQANFISSFLKEYLTEFETDFNLEKFRNKFLYHPPDIDILFKFAYAIAKLMVFKRMPEQCKDNLFTSQLELNLLFDFVLVIDACLKKKFDLPNFCCLAAELSKRTGNSLSQQKLSEINGMFNENFENTLFHALNRSLTLKDGIKITGIDNDIAISYGIRNRGAHEINSTNFLGEKYKYLLTSLFKVLFLIVDKIY
jgi:hypothetical protein